MKKRTLGKGLDALIPKEKKSEVPFENKGYTSLEAHLIKPNKLQPRKSFDEESLNELADSIKENGIIQPLVVRRKGSEYEIIAGERRWRASQRAGIKELPVIIKDVTESTVLQLALIENLQREDLNPIEEAEAYNQLIEEFSFTHEEVSKKIGKNRSTITNHIRLLKLSDNAKKALNSKEISAGHARALLSVDSDDQSDKVLEEIIKKKLSVRKTEELIKNLTNGEKTPIQPNKIKDDNENNDYFIEEIVEELTRSLGTKVKIKNKGEKGTIEIEYYSSEELERLIGMISRSR